MLIVILFIVISLVAGVIYFKFFKKDDMDVTQFMDLLYKDDEKK